MLPEILISKLIDSRKKTPELAEQVWVEKEPSSGYKVLRNLLNRNLDFYPYIHIDYLTLLKSGRRKTLKTLILGVFSAESSKNLRLSALSASKIQSVR